MHSHRDNFDRRRFFMIDLAPHHKMGLVVDSPILLGAGSVGYGDALPKGLDPAGLGCIVVGPVLAASRGGARPPRVAHLPGGIVLDTGLQNRGVSRLAERYARLWMQIGCPVVVQVYGDQPAALTRIVRKLAQTVDVAGVEILTPAAADAHLVAALVQAVAREAEWPVWVKLPLAAAAQLAGPAVEAGAVGLVIGQPLPGASMRRVHDGSAELVRGPVYGSLAFAPMLAALLEVAGLALPCALIASGGVHTEDQVRQALAAGAQAVQIDGAVWVEPGLPNRLARALTL